MIRVGASAPISRTPFIYFAKVTMEALAQSEEDNACSHALTAMLFYALPTIIGIPGFESRAQGCREIRAMRNESEPLPFFPDKI
jgi:hypothetical protein